MIVENCSGMNALESGAVREASDAHKPFGTLAKSF